MESVKKANKRLRQYPIILGKCSKTAQQYAICVTRDLDIKHKSCEKEFQEFKKCLLNAAKEMKTKL